METQEFGARLRELRKQAGLSQRELGDKIGINFTYLSKIENGVMPPPSDKVILKLAKILKTDKDDLLTLAGKIPADIALILKNREALQLLRSSRIQKTIRPTDEKRGFNIMKSLFKYKNLSRVAIPITLVFAIAASLWYAAPVPVRALTFEYPSLPSTGTLGRSYTFQVKVNVEEINDILPIYSIDLELRNTASPGTYTATVNSLPMPASGLISSSKSYTSAQTGGGGAVTVSATSAYGWAWALSGGGGRQGYGYRDPDGAGYWASGGSTFGYGYGYGGNQGDTSITFSVTWTPPSGWPTGSYDIKTLVNLDASKTKQWSDTSSTFTLARRLGRVVSGPGPAPTPPAPVTVGPGVVDVSDVVTDDGVFTQDVTTESDDGNVGLTIAKDTIGETPEGNPISKIGITTISTPAPATGAWGGVDGSTVDTAANTVSALLGSFSKYAVIGSGSVVGETYELEPSGATFDPPITVTFSYDPDTIPAGVSEEDLVISKWEEAAEVVAPPVVAPSPAAFSASNLTVQPSEVQPKEAISISVSVANTGDTKGSYTAVLKINGVQEAEKSLTIAAGGSQIATFSVTREEAGSYSVTVGDLSASFTVVAPPVTPPVEPEVAPEVEVPAPLAWWIWLIVGLAAVLVIGVIIRIVLRRRMA